MPAKNQRNSSRSKLTSGSRLNLAAADAARAPIALRNRYRGTPAMCGTCEKSIVDCSGFSMSSPVSAYSMARLMPRQ